MQPLQLLGEQARCEELHERKEKGDEADEEGGIEHLVCNCAHPRPRPPTRVKRQSAWRTLSIGEHTDRLEVASAGDVDAIDGEEAPAESDAMR